MNRFFSSTAPIPWRVMNVVTAAVLAGLFVPLCRADLGEWVDIQGASVYGSTTVQIKGSNQQVTVPNARFVGANTQLGTWHTKKTYGLSEGKQVRGAPSTKNTKEKSLVRS